MARNRVQFQKGYGLTQFVDEYRTEEKCMSVSLARLHNAPESDCLIPCVRSTLRRRPLPEVGERHCRNCDDRWHVVPRLACAQ